MGVLAGTLKGLLRVHVLVAFWGQTKERNMFVNNVTPVDSIEFHATLCCDGDPISWRMQKQ
jgi:hypothetical protein